MFDIAEQRKRIFWLCLAASGALMAGAAVMVGTKLGKKELIYFLLDQVTMCLLFAGCIAYAVFHPEGNKHNYTFKIREGKPKLAPNKIPYDPEGLRFLGFGIAVVCFTIFMISHTSFTAWHHSDASCIISCCVLGISFAAMLAAIFVTIIKLKKNANQ